MAEQGSEKLRDEFLSESQEIVEQLNRDLLAIADACLGRDPSTEGIRVDPDLINSAFRAVHSLKGLAGLSGVERMMHLSHHVENLLDALRLGKVLLTPHVLDLLFEAIEHYQLISAEVADHGLLAASPPSALVDDFVTRVNRADNAEGKGQAKGGEPTAVVAARVGGNGELIEPDVTGTLCEAPAPDALTAAIRRYLDDRPLREAHGAAARARCVAHFSMGAMVLGYTELYDELLARNP